MPKIIENLESKLIAEANRQIAQNGYGAMTIRSVAAQCGVGVGTVYNYFSSKEALLATCLLVDWKECVAVIDTAGMEEDLPETVVRCIYDQLRLFADRHQATFRDEAAVAAFGGSNSNYHVMLRAQLAAPLARFCADGFTAEFIAESLLVWTMAGKEFEELLAVIQKLF